MTQRYNTWAERVKIWFGCMTPHLMRLISTYSVWSHIVCIINTWLETEQSAHLTSCPPVLIPIRVWVCCTSFSGVRFIIVDARLKARRNIVEKVKKTIPASRGRTRRTNATKWLLKILFIGQACGHTSKDHYLKKVNRPHFKENAPQNYSGVIVNS